MDGSYNIFDLHAYEGPDIYLNIEVAHRT